MIIPVGLVFFLFTCAIGDVYKRSDGTADINIVNIKWSRPNTRFVQKRQAPIQNGTDVNTPIKKIDTNIHNDTQENQDNSISNNENTKIDGSTGTKKEALHDGLTEGGKIDTNPVISGVVTSDNKNQSNVNTADASNGNNATVNANQPPKNASSSNRTISTKSSETETAAETSPGVVKRGLIVFGGFTLMAIAYFIFYRKKNKKYDSGNTHNSNDTNQFRYGVLQSDDRRDNLELSRIPLTMESDEDEDDLEIFDLEQKKKSLSYVNLQGNDEDIVLNSSKDESKNNLLLDIEDGPSDTLINWSSNGSKSIL